MVELVLCNRDPWLSCTFAPARAGFFQPVRNPMRKETSSLKGFFLSLLCSACSVPSPPLSAVTVQYNPDGTETRQVRAGLLESQAEVERRLLTSIACPNYEIVAVSSGVDQPPQSAALHWVRYRCAGDS